MRHLLVISIITTAIVAGACNSGGRGVNDDSLEAAWRDSSAETVGAMLVAIDNPEDAARVVTSRIGEVSVREDAEKVVKVIRAASSKMESERKTLFASAIDSLVMEMDADRLARFLTLVWSQTEIEAAIDPAADERDQALIDAIRRRY